MLSNNIASYVLALTLAASFGVLYRPDALDLGKQLAGLSAMATQPAEGLVIALGSNVCVDLIVPARDVLSAGRSGGAEVSTRGADHAMLHSETDVLETFSFFMSLGAAAERSCDAGVFAALVARAGAASTGRRNLGGNAALMARKLAALGLKNTLLGGQVGPDAAKMLPPGVSLATPVMATDEVHLIAEYGKDETLPGLGTAPRANRFIVTADLANMNLDTMVATIQAADGAGAHALVIAGLHMLEPLPAPARLSALSALADALQARGRGYLLHLELASSADATWSVSVANVLMPLVDSVGFNEQEGAYLFESLGGVWSGASGADGDVAGTRLDVTGGSPRAVPVAGLLRFLFERYPSLGRLHFHALAMHVLAYHRPASGSSSSSGADESGARKTRAAAASPPIARWAAGAGPVAAGSVAASTEACRSSVESLSSRSDTLYSTSASRYNVVDPRGGAAPGPGTRRVTERSPVVTWTWSAADGGGVEYFLAPVLACKHPLSTVGLGDAISATGLASDVLPA